MIQHDSDCSFTCQEYETRGYLIRLVLIQLTPRTEGKHIQDDGKHETDALNYLVVLNEVMEVGNKVEVRVDKP